MTETFRLADQIRRAFEGSAWHGDSILELLADVNAKTAAARPIKDAHSIWEILLHIAAWDDVVSRRIGGTAVTLADAQNFPAVTDTRARTVRSERQHAAEDVCGGPQESIPAVRQIQERHDDPASLERTAKGRRWR